MKNIIKIFKFLALSVLALTFVLKVFCTRKKLKLRDLWLNFKHFLSEEERELIELETHRESFHKYCHDSARLFKDYFIPHDGNGHKPKILHVRSLAIITLLLFVVKISLTGYLFFVYPFEARMSAEVVKEVLRLTNEDRAAEGLEPLAMNGVLSASALTKANDMDARDYFAHYTPDGKKPWDFISRDDYPYIFVGENLAMNFTTAKSVHSALMNSPTHKKNIMNPKYQDIGLAMITATIDGKTTNVLVEMFGARKTAAPSANLAVNTETAPEPAPEQIPAPAESEPVVAGREDAEPGPLTATEPEPVSEPGPQPGPVSEPEPAVTEAELAPVETNVGTDADTENKVAQMTEEERPGPLPVQRIEAQEYPESPNPEIEDKNNRMNQVLAVDNKFDDSRMFVVAKISQYVNYFFVFILSFLTIVLAINIFVRMHIQHKHVIIQTMLVILFASSLAYFSLHPLEHSLSKILLM